MTEPRPDRPAPVPLEGWALELEGKSADAESSRELSQVVALLRDLPDPTPPHNLVAGVLERIAEEQSRPGFFERWVESIPLLTPRIGFAMAAGAAALLAVSISTERLAIPGGFDGGQDAPVQIAVAQTAVGNAMPRVLRRPTPVRRSPTAVVRPQFVSIYAPTTTSRSHAVAERHTIDHAIETRLDRQLNQLMLDPFAFAQRLEQMPQRDSFIARLAERAAERGDAPEIALSVRRSGHPLAGQIVNRMLRATLVAKASR